jgi:hypothetical protein
MIIYTTKPVVMPPSSEGHHQIDMIFYSVSEVDTIKDGS